MPELRRAADAGDAAAACKLAFELNGCTEMQKMELADSVGGGMKDSPDQPLATVAAHHQRCSAATEADLQDRYRYQAQVFGSGNAAAERWFVQSPLLDDDDFLINSPNAIDFRRRSQAYLAQAMKRKDIQDLKVLLQVYMPPGYGRSMSRLRVRDDAMFLALSAAAEQADVADEHDRALAAQVRRKAGGDVLALATQRAAHVGGPWRSAANAGPADAFFAPEACATLGNR